MKIKISFIIIFIFFTTTLSAQSKKELNLRIDTIQIGINNEKQVAQNLTLQIQNLTTELEKMNKGILLLTSQVVKQDSMNYLISTGIQNLKAKIEAIKKMNDSIRVVTKKVDSIAPTPEKSTVPWMLQTSGTLQSLNAICFADDNKGYVVGDEGVILKTINGGKIWKKAVSGTKARLISVRISSPNTISAISDAGIPFTSINEGVTWKKRLSNNIGIQILESMCFPNANMGYALDHRSENMGGYYKRFTRLVKTTDGGLKWKEGEFFEIWITAIHFVNANLGYAVSAYGISKTIDGGLSFDGFEGEAANFVYFIDSNNGYHGGNEGAILKTTDGGTSWTPQTSGTKNSLTAACFTDINTGYIVGENGTILKTINGGTTWKTLSSGTTDYLNSIIFTNALTGYVIGSSGTILKTITGGE